MEKPFWTKTQFSFVPKLLVLQNETKRDKTRQNETKRDKRSQKLIFEQKKSHQRRLVRFTHLPSPLLFQVLSEAAQDKASVISKTDKKPEESETAINQKLELI